MGTDHKVLKTFFVLISVLMRFLAFTVKVFHKNRKRYFYKYFLILIFNLFRICAAAGELRSVREQDDLCSKRIA